jgi:hypothetical protein
MSGWIIATWVSAAVALVFIGLYIYERVSRAETAWQITVSPCKDAEGKEVGCGEGAHLISAVCPTPGQCGDKQPADVVLPCQEIAGCEWEVR